MRKRRFTFTIRAILALFLTGLIVFSACGLSTLRYSGPNINGYRVFTMNEGVAHFSFSYPNAWNVELVDITDTSIYVSVNAPRLKKDKNDMFSSGWSIDITKPDNTYPDATTMMEHYLKLDADLPGYELMEQGACTVAGIKAEQVKFRCLAPTSDQGPATEPFTAHRVYFDYAGFIWQLKDLSHEQVIATDQPYLDNILSTFKILD
jgi:hypothetical protein